MQVGQAVLVFFESEYDRSDQAVWNATESPDAERILTDPVHDLLAAVRYVVKESASIGADPSYIGVSGKSAGGITVAHALILDLEEGDSGNAGFPSNVSVGISQSGGLSPFLKNESTRMVCRVGFCILVFLV